MQLTDAACRIDKALLLGMAGASLDQDGGLGMPDYLVETIFFVGSRKVRGEFTAETGATGWQVHAALLRPVLIPLCGMRSSVMAS